MDSAAESRTVRQCCNLPKVVRWLEWCVRQLITLSASNIHVSDVTYHWGSID